MVRWSVVLKDLSFVAGLGFVIYFVVAGISGLVQQLCQY